MRELKKPGGTPTAVRGPGPALRRDRAPELLLRQVTTLRTAADGLAPLEGLMQWAPYGLPLVDPLLRHIPLFSATVMFGEKTPEKALRIGTPERETWEETAESNMISRLSAATSDATAAYAAPVNEEALMSAARRYGSSGRAQDPWVRDPRSVIWTMGGPGVGETETWPREDMGITGVYSDSQGNGSSGGICHAGIMASDVGDAVKLEHLQGVKHSLL